MLAYSVSCPSPHKTFRSFSGGGGGDFDRRGRRNLTILSQTAETQQTQKQCRPRLKKNAGFAQALLVARVPAHSSFAWSRCLHMNKRKGRSVLPWSISTQPDSAIALFIVTDQVLSLFGGYGHHQVIGLFTFSLQVGGAGCPLRHRCILAPSREPPPKRGPTPAPHQSNPP